MHLSHLKQLMEEDFCRMGKRMGLDAFLERLGVLHIEKDGVDFSMFHEKLF